MSYIGSRWEDLEQQYWENEVHWIQIQWIRSPSRDKLLAFIRLLQRMFHFVFPHNSRDQNKLAQTQSFLLNSPYAITGLGKGTQKCFFVCSFSERCNRIQNSVKPNCLIHRHFAFQQARSSNDCKLEALSETAQVGHPDFITSARFSALDPALSSSCILSRAWRWFHDCSRFSLRALHSSRSLVFGIQSRPVDALLSTTLGSNQL